MFLLFSYLFIPYIQIKVSMKHFQQQIPENSALGIGTHMSWTPLQPFLYVFLTLKFFAYTLLILKRKFWHSEAGIYFLVYWTCSQKTVSELYYRSQHRIVLVSRQSYRKLREPEVLQARGEIISDWKSALLSCLTTAMEGRVEFDFTIRQSVQC